MQTQSINQSIITMNNKLFLELYNFVDKSNELLRNLSPENLELASNAGVVEALDILYDIVEREGLSSLEDTTSKL